MKRIGFKICFIVSLSLLANSFNHSSSVCFFYLLERAWVCVCVCVPSLTMLMTRIIIITTTTTSIPRNRNQWLVEQRIRNTYLKNILIKIHHKISCTCLWEAETRVFFIVIICYVICILDDGVVIWFWFVRAEANQKWSIVTGRKRSVTTQIWEPWRKKSSKIAIEQCTRYE